MLFERQYTLTETVETETRYDENGEAYEHTFCTVTLENFDLSHLPVYLLTEDKLSMYSLYMAKMCIRDSVRDGHLAYCRCNSRHRDDAGAYTDHHRPQQLPRD